MVCPVSETEDERERREREKGGDSIGDWAMGFSDLYQVFVVTAKKSWKKKSCVVIGLQVTKNLFNIGKWLSDLLLLFFYFLFHNKFSFFKTVRT